jgi:hypothetical protein
VLGGGGEVEGGEVTETWQLTPKSTHIVGARLQGSSAAGSRESQHSTTLVFIPGVAAEDASAKATVRPPSKLRAGYPVLDRLELDELPELLGLIQAQ